MTPIESRVEIEADLRALHDELRSTAVPASTAIVRAARRLGDPDSVHEPAPFGAPLSPVRAYAAAMLLVPTLLDAILAWRVQHATRHAMAFVTFQVAMLGLVVVGLIARRTWARAITLGMLAALVVELPLVCTHPFVVSGLHVQVVSWLVAFVLVAPWRRGELTAPGYAIALLGLAYHGAVLYDFELLGWNRGAWFGTFSMATGGVLVAGIGTLLRARWATLAALLAASALVHSAHDMLSHRMPNPNFMWENRLWVLIVGVVSSVGAGALAWRSSRSTRSPC
jgi:hypothetical protein